MKPSAAPDSWLIRDARPQESAALSDLSMRSKAHWGYPVDFMEACREELTVTAEDLGDADRYYRVAEVDGQLAGFYGIARLPGGDFELEALFVEPAHIGTGIGRQILADACELAASRGGGSMIIQGDPNAEAFYLAAGGVRMGSRPSESIPGRELPLFRLALR